MLLGWYLGNCYWAELGPACSCTRRGCGPWCHIRDRDTFSVEQNVLLKWAVLIILSSVASVTAVWLMGADWCEAVIRRRIWWNVIISINSSNPNGDCRIARAVTTSLNESLMLLKIAALKIGWGTADPAAAKRSANNLALRTRASDYAGAVVSASSFGGSSIRKACHRIVLT